MNRSSERKKKYRNKNASQPRPKPLHATHERIPSRPTPLNNTPRSRILSRIRATLRRAAGGRCPRDNPLRIRKPPRKRARPPGASDRPPSASGLVTRCRPGGDQRSREVSAGQEREEERVCYCGWGL